MYLNMPYILSGYACFYENQHDKVNISSAALENLGNERKKNKKKMEAAPHGSDDYIYYRILQLTFKVLMNSYYGILGQKDSVFYNAFVQNSITTTGQDLITTSMIAMENFLSNNVPFEDTDDILTFLSNIKSEVYPLDILMYVDEPVSKNELVEYLLGHVRNGDGNRSIVNAVVSKLSVEQCTVAYYKNQFFELMQNSWGKNTLDKLSKLSYTDKPEPDMVPILDEFRKVILEFCHYNYLYEDRYKRAIQDKRKTIICVDTDLVIWVRYREIYR